MTFWMEANIPHSTDAAEAWASLEDELDAWADTERRATFWWRDDDATTPTPALERLLRAAGRHGVPLALAVIPRDTGEALPAALPPSVAVLQHGWAHANHAAPPAKKAELGDDRPLAEVAGELTAGWDRLAGLFGRRALPVVTPPWNRVGAGVASALPSMGFRGLSTFGPRPEGGGIMRINTHADVIDWRGGRRFAGTAAVLAAVVAHLRGRRLGTADAEEPTGLLTHHLDHDDGVWEFIDRFFDKTRHHPVTAWPSAEELFPYPDMSTHRPSTEAAARERRGP
ncbi:MAG TPA: polysaccharide deacetylase family protein [Alphaproteobacteria bacterium]|nr:polysaccharide deacetylase family protein [Alphaproteobacteria bacterium]